MKPSTSTIKMLFALSGNLCAYPGCKQKLVDNKIIFGEVCHIRAAKPGGRRYDPNMTEVERHDIQNLILLCANHHTAIDSSEQLFTVEMLVDMKNRHEAKFRNVRNRAREETKILASFFAGVISERVLSTALKYTDEQGESKLLYISEVSDLLKYGPKGSFASHTRYPREFENLKNFLDAVFSTAGWRKREYQNIGVRPSEQSDVEFLFMLPDRHQLSNADKCIRRVFEECGFQATKRDVLATQFSKDSSLTIFCWIGLQQ